MNEDEVVIKRKDLERYQRMEASIRIAVEFESISPSLAAVILQEPPTPEGTPSPTMDAITRRIQSIKDELAAIAKNGHPK